jgi:hypothetical protein
MKKPDGDGREGGMGGAHAERGSGRPSLFARAFRLPAPVAVIDGVMVVPLSNLLRLALPPLLISSLPKRAIGFSFPRGFQGKLLGTCILCATAAIAFLATKAYGPIAGLAMVWLAGGTGVVMLYNSTGHGIAFVKQLCSTCRLRPIIEEHEIMHLNGEPSEDAVWREARKKYSYDGLGLGTDPKICSFCPIAKRLKESP